MADREKVINALGRCESYGYCKDTNCPYHESVNCLELLRKDALSLLKEQKEVVRCIDCKHYDSETGICAKGITHGYAAEWFCADGEGR